MSNHLLRLVGPAAHGARIGAPLLRDVLHVLVDGAEQAVRLRIEGRSTAPGKAQPWLERATLFELVAVEDGSTCLHFDAPALAEAIPELLAPGEVSVPFDPQKTCLDLLNDALADVLAGNEDSDLFDEGLVATMASFSKALRHGIEGIELCGADRSIRLGREDIETIRRLRRQTPLDRQAIVVGTLDSLRHHDRMFTLILDTGEVARGVLAGETSAEEIGSLWGRRVRVGGIAKFRPSGKVLRIDASLIEPAENEGSFFSQLPKPLTEKLEPRSLQQPQTLRSGVGAFFGTWPGDETDEDLLAMLHELRSFRDRPS